LCLSETYALKDWWCSGRRRPVFRGFAMKVVDEAQIAFGKRLGLDLMGA
jgi:hypothetical protein